MQLGSNLSGQAMLIADQELFELHDLEGAPLGMIEAITNEFEAPGTLAELA